VNKVLQNARVASTIQQQLQLPSPASKVQCLRNNESPALPADRTGQAGTNYTRSTVRTPTARLRSPFACCGSHRKGLAVGT